MKNKGLIITLIILLSVISISLFALMFVLMNGNIKMPKLMFGSKVSENLIIDKVFNGDFQNVNIESDAGDIYVKHSSDNNFRVVVYGDKKNTILNTSSSSLSIKNSSEKCIGFCFNKVINKVEVYIPREYKNKITVVNSYGDITIDDFKGANIDVEEDCGDVKVISGNIVDINNSYGDITVDYGNIINVKESAGDVTVGIANDIMVENSFGNINITKVNKYLNLKDDCGDIIIDEINLEKKSIIKDSFGDIKVGKTNKIYIDAKTDLGDVNINRNYHKSDVILKITNDCGDIDVTN